MQVQYNVKITRQTTLDKLYTYDSDYILEFPETSARGSIGHLFPFHRFNPARNFVYSQGEPRGMTGKKAVYCDILTDSESKKVPCKMSFATCKYLTSCFPFASTDLFQARD